MNEVAREMGRTARTAIRSWPATARLCVLLLAVAVVLWAR